MNMNENAENPGMPDWEPKALVQGQWFCMKLDCLDIFIRLEWSNPRMTNLKSSPDFTLRLNFHFLILKECVVKILRMFCSVAIHWLLLRFHNLFISSVIYNNYVILEIGMIADPENETMTCQITSVWKPVYTLETNKWINKIIVTVLIANLFIFIETLYHTMWLFLIFISKIHILY